MNESDVRQLWRDIRKLFRMLKIMATGFMLQLFGTLLVLSSRAPSYRFIVDGDQYQTISVLRTDTTMLVWGKIAFCIGVAVVVGGMLFMRLPTLHQISQWKDILEGPRGDGEVARTPSPR